MTNYTPSCTTCFLPKKPIGRSVSMYAANGYCDHECPGYYGDPEPSYYWSAADEKEMREWLSSIAKEEA